MAPTINIAPLIEDALDALRNQTGLEAVIEPQVEENIDAAITIKRGDRVWRFNVEVKPWLNTTIIGLLKDRIRAKAGEWVLVTHCVTPGQGDELRALNLPFLDTAGNAFIKLDDLYVFVKGQRAARDGKPQKAALYRPGELKVVFAFLCQDGLEARTHLQIKQVAGVGLATVNRAIAALEQAGFIMALKGKGRRLVRKQELMEQWAIAYPVRLRPKQVIGTFAGTREPWWRDVDPVDFGAQWGGEVAANYLTQYLKPQTVTLYATKQPDQLIIRQKLRKDPGGDVEILKRFWNFAKPEGKPNVVPALLVYADLLATGNDRNIETARMIYDQYLVRPVEKG